MYDQYDQLSERWERPFTAKRYLHPPFAEYLYTIWPDLKILCGPVTEQTCGYRSSAFRLLLGDDYCEPDFRQTKTLARADGFPIHALSYQTQKLRLDMEAVCDTGVRVPSVFVKITLNNLWDAPLSQTLWLLPRTGREDHLVGMEVDGYAHFDSNVHNFGFLPSAWTFDGSEYLTDGEFELCIGRHTAMELQWQGDLKGRVWYQRHLLRLHTDLAAGESRVLTLMLRPCSDKPRSFCYEEQKERSAAFWAGELQRLRRVPASPEHRDIVNNLVIQCLQMFAYPLGKDYVLPRQGGLQRVIWPTEANEFLMALDLLGDFSVYTQAAYDTFFDVLQRKEGEDAGGIFTTTGWASCTGAALWCCGRYLAQSHDKQAYRKYRDAMYLGFCWIERKRAQSEGCAYRGIFPPMKSSDWPGEYQSWCLTDCTNLMGMRYLAEAFEYFDDPSAPEIRRAYDTYMARMKELLAEELRQNTRSGELLLTNKLGVQLCDPPSGPYFDDGPANLLRAGVMDPNSEAAHLVENYFRNRGCMRNGLTGLMNDGLIFQGFGCDPWAGHSWYLSSTDHWWFEVWLAQGEREKARQTLEAQYLYGMSPAYQLLERYADNDPYWVPWMPNASANGRLLQMMCEFYGVAEPDAAEVLR